MKAPDIYFNGKKLETLYETTVSIGVIIHTVKVVLKNSFAEVVATLPFEQAKEIKIGDKATINGEQYMVWQLIGE